MTSMTLKQMMTSPAAAIFVSGLGVTISGMSLLIQASMGNGYFPIAATVILLGASVCGFAGFLLGRMQAGTHHSPAQISPEA